VTLTQEAIAEIKREQANLGFVRGAELTLRQVEGNDLLAGTQTHTLLRGGSRSGKTFLLVRAILYRAMRGAHSRHAILRLRANAARSSIWLDTLPKVLRASFPPGFSSRVRWYRQDGFVELPNGSQVWVGGLDDAERVEKILGMEFATLLFNETTQIPYASVLTALTRLAQQIPGLSLRAYYDCNPSGMTHYTYRLFKQFVDPETKRAVDPNDYREMQMNPEDNRANIAPGYIENILAKLPERQRRRFWAGEWSQEVDGALWAIETVDRSRLMPPDGTGYDQWLADMHIPPLVRCVVGVDPSGTSGTDEPRSGRPARSDEVGIVVAGLGSDGRGYVLADRTCRLGPAGWARIAAQAANEFRADSIVAEANFGGAMVQSTLSAADPGVPVRLVSASRGKAVRAEPIAALFEEDRVRLVGQFPELEEQLLSMSTAGYMGARSPDRLDAMVWALTELLLGSRASMADFL
jgi:phage terminase large subunit-like protein